ncbi:MAG: exopolyphosphatase / guanosine-5-triphosphate,3-diphosphate pyrophosphatase [Actinomycetota bacterium]|jgi:exopolyphosphatase/guanosine-5'-triphosphate,3'-diphosphate pyrophosphatase|nr:exopolyphosphatase / guanosine-5-triphosphate,3-diphosphate pyrophosphatase [Actinomycetota bacterium]
MRLGVLDVGSNTVHLLIVDAHPGGHPDPVRSHKTELQLAELLQADGSLGPAGTDVLVAAVSSARVEAEAEGVEDLVAFATSAVRDATDSVDVLARVRDEAHVDLQVLPGEDEARLTFLAVRRWFGWSAGRLLCLDIGGGSLELATGLDEEPSAALSLPLGAGRLTRELLPGDPPKRREVAAVREHVRGVLADAVPLLAAEGEPDRAVVTSKTFRSLARLDGAAPYAEGPRVPRSLSRAGLEGLVELLAAMRAVDRARLPGVSPSRSHQLLAGAIVAAEALEALGLERVDVCPWALREGVILRRLDWLAGA